MSPAKEKENIETHDFSTPTEWNVEMVNDKVIVTLSGENKLNYFYVWIKEGVFRQTSGSALWAARISQRLGRNTNLVWDLNQNMCSFLLLAGCGRSKQTKKNKKEKHKEPDSGQLERTHRERSDPKMSQTEVPLTVFSVS